MQKVQKRLALLLVLFCLFPYVSPIPTSMDSQPYAAFMGVLLYIINPVKINDKRLKWLLYSFIFAALLILISGLSIASIRPVYAYFSLFFVTLMSYKALNILGGVPYGLFRIAVWGWFGVGVVQMFVSPSFGSFLLPRGDVSAFLESGRGVSSLAPEPTFYGIISLLLLIILYLNFKDHNDFTRYRLLIVAQLLMSMSSTCVMIIVATLFVYMLWALVKLHKYKYLFYALGALAVIIVSVTYLVENFTSDFRIFVLLSKLMEDPRLFVVLDASVNERFNNAFFPLYGSVHDLFLPHGYSYFPDFIKKCMSDPNFKIFFESDYILETKVTRIQSGIGALFFELGFMAFLVLHAIKGIFAPIVRGNNVNRFFYFMLLIILVNAINFSTAIIPFIFGNCLYLAKQQSLCDK